MADEYNEDFDYVPEDFESEIDLQEKKVEQSNRVNKIKNIQNDDSQNNFNKIEVENEEYNFDTIKNKNSEFQDKENDDEIEEIKLDDIDGEADYKISQKNPKGLSDNLIDTTDFNRRNMKNNIKNISSIPMNENLNSSTQTNKIQHLNKDLYINKKNIEISRIETYNNLNSSNNKYVYSGNEKINLSHISQNRTPKNLENLKQYSQISIGNNVNVSKSFEPYFGNESNYTNKNKHYYSNNNVERNKSYLDSFNTNFSPTNNSYKKNQQNSVSVLNNYNYINNNSYISYKMPNLREINSKIIKSGKNNISKLQYAELKYDELKNFYSRTQQYFTDKKIIELENNTTIEKEKVLEFISKHNLELLKYIDNLNKIINIVIEASKVQIKNSSLNNVKINPNIINSNINEVNNNKLLENFKKEFLKLNYRFKQISDPAYEENLEETIADLKDQVNYFESENKKLKITQKQSEALFERQYRTNNLTFQSKNLEINKVNIDYENTRRLNDKVLEKIQKNKMFIADNEQKINEINDWLTKLESIAREMYGITEFIDKESMKKIEKEEKQKNDLKFALKKKTEVLEKVLVTNKKKFETEIVKNEKTILNLEKQKLELMSMIKEKSNISKTLQIKVRQLYSGYDNNIDLFKNNSSSDNYDELNNQLIVSNNNTKLDDIYQDKNIQNQNQNTIRNDEDLENNNNIVMNNIGKNSNITNNSNIISHNLQHKMNNSNINAIDDNKERINLINGRISIQSENLNNLNLSKKEVLDNLGKETNIEGQSNMQNTQNKRSNKPNFKFNVNLNQLNANSNNIQNVPTSNIDIKNSMSMVEDISNNNLIHKNQDMRDSISKPFRINSTASKYNNLNNEEQNKTQDNIFAKPNNNINENLKNNSTNQLIENNNNLSTSGTNIIKDENQNNNILNANNSRRKNFNNILNKQNETSNSNNQFNSNIDQSESSKKITAEKQIENNLLNDELKGNIPNFLSKKTSNNTNVNNDDIEELEIINPINSKNNNSDKQLNIKNETKKNRVSETKLFNLEQKRDNMIGKEKKNILQNMFSDDDDEIINLDEEEKLNVVSNPPVNPIKEEKKKAFDNLFKEQESIDILDNNNINSQRKKNINILKQQKEIEDNENKTKTSFPNKKENYKNVLDELEDIIL